MQLLSAMATQRGRRDQNEDAGLVALVDGVFAVSDGMGGMDAGDLASRIAIDTLARARVRLGAEAAAINQETTASAKLALAESLEDLANTANDAIRAEAETRKGRMGATLTVAVVSGATVFISHVGDTRAYRVRDGVAVQLTEDTSVAALRLRLGRMTQEEYDVSPLRAVLHDALGIQPEVEPEFLSASLQTGDALVLCSDGVWGHLLADDIAELAVKGDPEEAANALVRRAYYADSDDNLTAVVVHCSSEQTVEAAELTLARIPLFEQFSPAELSRLAPFLEPLECDVGELICREHDPGDCLFVLVSGEVDILRAGRVLTRLQAPLQFGEIALVRGSPRTASVQAATPVRLLSLHRDQINLLLRRRPDLGASFMMQLSRHLAERVVDLTEKLAQK
jgi:PPM family protein phosphatase